MDYSNPFLEGRMRALQAAATMQNLLLQAEQFKMQKQQFEDQRQENDLKRRIWLRDNASPVESDGSVTLGTMRNPATDPASTLDQIRGTNTPGVVSRYEPAPGGGSLVDRFMPSSGPRQFVPPPRATEGSIMERMLADAGSAPVLSTPGQQSAGVVALGPAQRASKAADPNRQFSMRDGDGKPKQYEFLTQREIQDQQLSAWERKQRFEDEVKLQGELRGLRLKIPLEGDMAGVIAGSQEAARRQVEDQYDPLVPMTVPDPVSGQPKQVQVRQSAMQKAYADAAAQDAKDPMASFETTDADGKPMTVQVRRSQLGQLQITDRNNKLTTIHQNAVADETARHHRVMESQGAQRIDGQQGKPDPQHQKDIDAINNFDRTIAGLEQELKQLTGYQQADGKVVMKGSGGGIREIEMTPSVRNMLESQKSGIYDKLKVLKQQRDAIAGRIGWGKSAPEAPGNSGKNVSLDTLKRIAANEGESLDAMIRKATSEGYTVKR